MEARGKSGLLFDIEPVNGNGDSHAPPRVRGISDLERRSFVLRDEAIRQGADAFTFYARKQLEAQTAFRYHRQYAWAHAATKRIAWDIGGLPRLIKPENEPDADPVERGPLYDLLKKPNPLTPSSRLFKTTELHVQTAGNAFWLLETGSPTFQGMVREIWTLRPDSMRPLLDRDSGEHIGWKYDPGFGGGSTVFPREAVVHFSLIDPQDLLMGLSPFAPIDLAIRSSLAATVWNLNFFRKNATPGLIARFPAGLNDENYNRLQQQLRDQRVGVDNAWSLLILEGNDVELQNMTNTHSEMGFTDLQKLNREETLAIFGVPPAVGGDWQHANFAQTHVQRELYWTSTLLPQIEDREDTINHFLVPRVQPGMMLKLDTSTVKELQPDRDAELDRKTKRIAHGLASPNEIREEEGKEPIGPEGEVFYMQAGIRPIGARPEPPPFDQDAVEAMAQLDTKAAELARETKNIKRDAVWKQFDSRLRRAERFLFNKWRNILRVTYGEIDKALRRTPLPDAPAEKPVRTAVVKQGDDVRIQLPLPPHSYLPAFDDLNQFIISELEAVYLNLVREFGQAAAREIVATATFDSGATTILGLVDRQRQRIGVETATLLDNARSILEEGLKEGETIGAMSQRIQDKLLGEGGRARADRIARTEALASANAGKFEGYQQQGVREIEWLSSRDGLVRDSHKAETGVDGEQVLIGTPFSNGLLYPGDPDGAASEVVNCRCTHVQVIPAIDGEAA